MVSEKEKMRIFRPRPDIPPVEWMHFSSLTKLRGHVVELLFVFAGLVKDHVDEVLGLRLLDVDHRKLGASPGYLYSKRDWNIPDEQILRRTKML